MAWTTGNATAYNGDTSRFVVLGDSAGGNLAINTAYKVAAEAIASPCGELPDVAAVAVVYPAVAPEAIFTNTYPITSSLGLSFAEDYIGGSPHTVPDRYKSVTSNTWISPAAPPTLVVQGENDHLVSAEPVYNCAGDSEEVDHAWAAIPVARCPWCSR